MPKSVEKYSNCPHCGVLLKMDVWECRPEWLAMFVRVSCCDSYANVKWRETYNKPCGVRNAITNTHGYELDGGKMKGFNMNLMTFGIAVEQLKRGNKVSRKGWNGKGMYLELQTPDENSKMTLPYIWMWTACGNRVPWLASQTDVLAEDWDVVE